MGLREYYDISNYKSDKGWSKSNGNLFAYAIRKYILDILKEANSKYTVSYNNSFIIGDPTEYDLLLIDTTNEDRYKKGFSNNQFDSEDAKYKIELKSGGYVGGLNPKLDGKPKQDNYYYISIYDGPDTIKELDTYYTKEFVWVIPNKEYQEYTGGNVSYFDMLKKYEDDEDALFDYIEAKGLDEKFKEFIEDIIKGE